MINARSALLALGVITGNANEFQVFTFADHYHPMLGHLARSVEVAGGLLHVMGLREGRKKVELLGLGLGPKDSAADYQWHFEDKFVMLKKHLFLYRAIKGMPANLTVIFVDAFDVLFQRPLEEMIQKYNELAQGHVEQHGSWPVIFGGDLNCWPFPHNARLHVPRKDGTNRSWLHRIPWDAALSSSYHNTWRYPGRRGEISGDEVCREWLAAHSDASEAPQKRPQNGVFGLGQKAKRRRFHFLCSGTFVGKVNSLLRLLHEMFQLYQTTSEYHDQALIPLLLLQFPHLGFVDKEAQLFLGLHGHDEFWDLERGLCRGNYFEKKGSSDTGHPSFPSFQALSAPRLLGSDSDDVPKLLHFNGNGKRHMWRCVEEFRKDGLLIENDIASEFFDVDGNAWNSAIKWMGRVGTSLVLAVC